MSDRTCVDCRWLEDPDGPYKWHRCNFPVEPSPLCVVSVNKATVNICNPFQDCRTWEKRPETEVPSR